MSKRKGVSAEEKRTRMLDLLYERRDFFQMRELERLGPKEKGVVAQSVKDVIQSLVDEGLVDTDKIGTSVYFWAFPSKGSAARRTRLAALEEELAAARRRHSALANQLMAAAVGREAGDSRAALLDALEAVRQQAAQLEQQLEQLAGCDPKKLAAVRAETADAVTAANRWTDNISNIKTWCQRVFAMEGAMLDKQFSIPDDMDYVE